MRYGISGNYFLFTNSSKLQKLVEGVDLGRRGGGYVKIFQNSAREGAGESLETKSLICIYWFRKTYRATHVKMFIKRSLRRGLQTPIHHCQSNFCDCYCDDKRYFSLLLAK